MERDRGAQRANSFNHCCYARVREWFGRSGKVAAFNCDFIGTTDLPKQYGSFRI